MTVRSSFVAVAVVVVTVFVVGCSQMGHSTSPTAPSSALMAPTSLTGGTSAAAATPAGKPEIDPTYANGTTVYMIGPQLIEGARESMPQAYAHAEELYIVVYPQTTVPAPGAPPITLPSGYQPQCDPCFHPGLPPQFVYHDHVITGAPGMGANGTAGAYKAPWKIVIVLYNPTYVSSTGFIPIKSAADIDTAEAAGNVFLPFNQTPGANPYEFEPGNLLICPTVSSKA